MSRKIIAWLLIFCSCAWGQEEIISMRTPRSKTYKTGKRNQYINSQSIGNIHYSDAEGNYHDIDLTIDPIDLSITKADYQAHIYNDKIGFWIINKAGDLVEETITTNNGTNLDTHGELIDNKMVYKNVEEGIDVEIIPSVAGMKQNFIVYNQQALGRLNNLRVKLISNKLANIKNEKHIQYGSLIEEVKCYDADFKEIEFERNLSAQSNLMDISLKGNMNDYKFPIVVDPTVMDQEQIGASADDASQPTIVNTSVTIAGTTIAQFTDGGRVTGLRFQTIPIPQNSTIDSAKLTIYYYGYPNYDKMDCDVQCQDSDDALLFVAGTYNGNISDRPRTTASVLWQENWLNNGWKESPELKTIVQEVISRAGWVQNNNIVFLLDANRDWLSGGSLFYAWDYPSNQYGAKLDITYTRPAYPLDHYEGVKFGGAKLE